MSIEILEGNCLDTLKQLPDQCVNTCITSPPYWGLRDYGTATWIGGDPNCNHMRDSKVNPNGKTQIAQAGGQAVGNFAVQLIAGEDPASAARKAGASALASHVAKSVLVPFLGPVGGLIGGLVGGAVGGRVICNELMKQGLLSKEDVILDYRFTRDYLTPQHVNGYHLWAVWVVKQMRKGRMVSFWKYIAQSRANEIAYIYGRRDKPDYVGKVVRTIGEPVCWFFGLFCKKTDWSTLYNEKEI